MDEIGYSGWIPSLAIPDLSSSSTEPGLLPFWIPLIHPQWPPIDQPGIRRPSSSPCRSPLPAPERPPEFQSKQRGWGLNSSNRGIQRS